MEETFAGTLSIIWYSVALIYFHPFLATSQHEERTRNHRKTLNAKRWSWKLSFLPFANSTIEKAKLIDCVVIREASWISIEGFFVFAFAFRCSRPRNSLSFTRVLNANFTHFVVFTWILFMEQCARVNCFNPKSP